MATILDFVKIVLFCFENVIFVINMNPLMKTAPTLVHYYSSYLGTNTHKYSAVWCSVEILPFGKWLVNIVNIDEN